MGEYADQYILDTFGIDISDDDSPERPRELFPEKRFGCSCGKAFVSAQALKHHQDATGHPESKRALKRKEINYERKH
jgi:hypothetical protein